MKQQPPPFRKPPLSATWRNVGRPTAAWSREDEKTHPEVRQAMERLARVVRDRAAMPRHAFERSLLLFRRMVGDPDALTGDVLGQVERLVFSDRPLTRIRPRTHALLAKTAQRLASRGVVRAVAPGFEGYFQAEARFTQQDRARVASLLDPLDEPNALAVRGAWNALYAPPLEACALSEKVTYWLRRAEADSANRAFFLTEILRLLDPHSEAEPTGQEAQESRPPTLPATSPSVLYDDASTISAAISSSPAPEMDAMEKALLVLSDILRVEPRPRYLFGVEVPVGSEIEALPEQALDPSLVLSLTADLSVPETVHVMWADEADGQARERYRKNLAAVQPYIDKLRDALSFRHERPAWPLTGLRRGSPDPRALHRLTTSDLRVFRRKNLHRQAAVYLGVLVDESGSMRQNAREVVAQQSTIMIYHALQRMHGVRVGIWGHTGDAPSFGPGCLIYRYVEPGTAPRAERLGQIQSRQENYDGLAIQHVAQQMQGHRLPGERCILLVLSDGSPSGNGYRGAAAQAHTQDCVARARAAGVDVLGVGLGKDLDPDLLKAIYGRSHVHVEDVKQLPARLGRLVATVLS